MTFDPFLMRSVADRATDAFLQMETVVGRGLIGQVSAVASQALLLLRDARLEIQQLAHADRARTQQGLISILVLVMLPPDGRFVTAANRNRRLLAIDRFRMATLT